jgi:TPR repeat protein
MVVTRRNDEMTWFVYGATRETIDAVWAAFTAKTAPPIPPATQPSAALVMRNRNFATLTPMADSKLDRLDPPLTKTYVRLEGTKLEFTVQGAPDTARHLLIRTLFGYIDQAHSPKNAQLMLATCELGSDDGCNGAGVAYLEWKGVKDVLKARKLLQMGCDHQHGMACANLAGLLFENERTESRKAYARSCELGLPLGCASLGNILADSSDPKDQKQAPSKLRMGCEHGFGAACTNLGYQYFEGRGVSLDKDRAVGYYERACGLSNGLGCILLGHVFAAGEVRARNPSMAIDLYKKACDLKLAVGCYWAGSGLLSGQGIEKDEDSGKRFLGRACDQGHADSCRILAELAGGNR